MAPILFQVDSHSCNILASMQNPSLLMQCHDAAHSSDAGACHPACMPWITWQPCNAQAHGESTIVEELFPEGHHDEILGPATEGAAASALEVLAGKVWQQLEGRLAAWVQETFTACAAVSTKLALKHDDMTSDSKESQAAGQADICPHIEHALPVKALEAKLTASNVMVQILQAVDAGFIKGPMSTKVCQDALHSLISHEIVLMDCSPSYIY